MKINGRVVDKPNQVILVLPRDEGDLVFRFDAVVDESEFYQLHPQPKPPRKTKKGVTAEDPNDENYKKSFAAWGNDKMDWAFLKSIAATEGLEWSTVIMDQPATWKNWKADIKAAKMSTMEGNLLFQAFLEANSISDDRLREARERFLLAQAADSSPE